MTDWLDMISIIQHATKQSCIITASYMEAFTVGVKCVGEVVVLLVVFVLEPVFAQSS